jgi:hypothetical protein
MALKFTDSILAPENVMFRELEGEAVLLNLDSECYFGLDDVGTRMWRVLTKSNSIQDAFEILLTEYEVEPDLLREDLIDLLERLVEKGLLKVNGI